MAKQRRTNTAVSAMSGLLDTIGAVAKVELKDNPEELAKVDKMVADVKDSNFTTAQENLDDAIEFQHQAAEAQEQAEAEAQAEEQENEAIETIG